MASLPGSSRAGGGVLAGDEEAAAPAGEPTAPPGVVPSALASAVLGLIAAFGLATAVAGAVDLIGSSYNLLYGVYVIAFAGLLPLAVVVAAQAPRRARPGVDLASAAIALGAALVALLCLLRAAGSAGAPDGPLAVTAIAGGLLLSLLAILGPGSGAWPQGSLRLSGRDLAIAAGVMAALVLTVFTPFHLSGVTIAAAAAIGLAATLVPRLPSTPSPPRPALVAADVAVLALALLVVADVSGYWGADAGVSTWGGLSLAEMTNIAHFHEHFYLGPVNDVLHGRTLLVDSNAVYGIGNTYLIAGWFQLVPFGYGPFGLLGCLFSAGVIAAGWGVMRAVAVNRLIAAVTVAIGLMLTILVPYNSPALFLNTGGLRFLPPYLLLGVAMLASRREGPVARSPWVLGTFAFFSLWSVDTIAYCGSTFLAIAAVDALRTPSVRAGVRHFAGSLAALLASAAAAHVLFALVTLVASGNLPDWSRYFVIFSAWADVLHLIPAASQPWSIAWLVGAVYLATGAGVVALVHRDPLLLEGPSGRRLALALGGTSALGASFLSYFVTHSLEVFLPFIAYPALLVLAIWLSLAIGRSQLAPRHFGPVAIGLAAFLAALLVAGSWDESERRLPRTALAHLIPGGSSLGEDLSLMWDSPPIDPRSPEAVRLIDRYLPADRALVLTELDLGQEAMMRSDRANLLPISYPFQDDVALDETLPPVFEAVDALPAGTLALLQRKNGGLSDSQEFGANGDAAEGELLGPLAKATFERIRERFTIEPIAAGDFGLYVGELTPRSEP